MPFRGLINERMANGITFISRPGKTAQVPIYVRVRLDGKDYVTRVPEITTTADTWPHGKNAQIQIRTYYPVLGKIFTILSDYVKKGDFTRSKMDDAINALVYGDSREKARKEVQKLKEERKKLSFTDYYEKFIKDLESGKRKSEKGVAASARTITNYRQGLNRIKEFQQSRHSRITWESINRDLLTEYIQFLQSPRRGKDRYNTNTVAKRIKEIKHLFRAAREDGVTDLPVPEFRFGEVAVDSIYLTKEEIERFASVDLSGLSPAHETARDLFLVGVYSGQRVSDYRSISPDQIDTDEDGRMYITFYQKKTHKEVTVPVRKPLRDILAKYNNNLPTLCDQTINICIKEIGKRAKIDDIIEYTSTKGGREHITKSMKYELITTHTARRTFATLAYLDGMDSMDIRRITGHSSELLLAKYIKSTAHDTARMMARKSSFWD